MSSSHDNGHGHHGSPFIQHHFEGPKHQFDSGKMGIWLFLVTEVLFFSGLFVAYIIYRSHHPEIFAYANHYLDTKMGAINTAVLIFSSLTAAWAVRCAQLNQKRALIATLSITIVCAFVFLGIKYVEYSEKFEHGTLWGAEFNPHISPNGTPLHGDGHGGHGEEAPGGHGDEAEAGHGDEAEAGHGDEAEESQGEGEGEAATAQGEEPAGDDESGDEEASSSGDEAADEGESAPGDEAAGGEATDAPGDGAEGADQADEGAALAEAEGHGDEEASGSAGAHGDEATGGEHEDEPAAAAAGDSHGDEASAGAGGHGGGRGGHGNDAFLSGPPPPNTSMFFSIYFGMTGLHAIHVTAGIIVFIWLLIRAIRGHFDSEYFGPVDYAALYWHLVDLIWIYLFPLLYLIH